MRVREHVSTQRGRSLLAASLTLLAALAGLAGPGAGNARAVPVSLGDSFASGEGAGLFDRGTEEATGNGCERTPNAWPRLLGVPEWGHFACDGATIRSLLVPQKAGSLAGPDAVSQVDRLRAMSATQRVTRVYVMIGINDTGFGPILYGCVARRCLLKMQSVVLPSLQTTIGPGVAADLRQVKAAATPGAEIVLVGYPDIVAKRRTASTCPWLDVGERTRMRLFSRQLDLTFAAVARQAGAAYVSTRKAFAGHELCSFDSWMTPLARRDPRKEIGWRLPGHGAHPNLRGQVGIAFAVRNTVSE